MKITFILPGLSLTGGVRVVAIYADCLQKLGHQIHVVAPKQRQPKLFDQFRSLAKGRGWIEKSKPQPSYFDRLNISLTLTDSDRPIVDSDLPDADAVVATWWETAEWVVKLSPAKGAKVYFVQHHELFDYLPQERAADTYRLPLHKIVVAKWLVDLMAHSYGDRQVSLVPNSVDTEQFYAAPRGKQPVPTVGLYYNDVPWKGCDISLKAFALANQKNPDLRLVAMAAIEPLPHLPLPPKTEYCLRVPQETLRQIYAKCDAWLFASRSEGFGLPILEAMACRTPVIGTPAGASPELLAGGTGILVKPADPEDMAEAIVHLCRLSDVEWRTMSDAAYARAMSYTWTDATKLFEAALCTAIDRQK